MINKRSMPEIRLAGFNDDWEQYKLHEFVKYYSSNLTVKDANKNGKYDLYDANNLIGKTECEPITKDYITVIKDGAGVGRIRKLPKNTMFIGTMGALVPKDSDLDFVFSLLNRFDLGEQNSGSTIPHIYFKDYGNNDYYIPKIIEQEQIGAYFKNFDYIIMLHQHEIDKLNNIRKAMIDKMFPQNGEEVPAVRFTGFTEPWVLKEFSEIFTERHFVDTISDEYPQLSFTIEEGVIKPEDKKTNKRDFLIIDKANKKYLQTEYDDIIYNPANVIYGAIHRNALGKGCVSPIYKIFSTDQDATFMECIVRHPRFIKEISRSMEGTVKKLRTLKPKAFLEMSAYIAPTREEQQLIAAYFNNLDRLLEIEKRELDKIKHIRDSCMKKMFV